MEGTLYALYTDEYGALKEQMLPFSTLDELFELCAQANPPFAADRIILRKGDGRSVTLSFLSASGG